MKSKFNFGLIVLMVVSILMLKTQKNIVADELSLTQKEKIRINKSYDKNDLARKLNKAIEKEPTLSNLIHKDDIYIWQKEEKIIMKGTLPNKDAMERIAIIAGHLEGINRINIEQVQIR